MFVDPATVLRDSGLRVTKQRVAVMRALAEAPHSGADAVLERVRTDVGQVSTHAVYDVLKAMEDAGRVRRLRLPEPRRARLQSLNEGRQLRPS